MTTTPAPTMSSSPATSSSSQVTRAAVAVLSIGWRLSFAIVIIGLVLSVVRDEPLTSELGEIDQVVDDLLHGHSNGFLGLGILVMILSPIVTTGTIAFNFLRLGDRRYGLIASAVFVVLLISIAIAIL